LAISLSYILPSPFASIRAAETRGWYCLVLWSNAVRSTQEDTSPACDTVTCVCPAMANRWGGSSRRKIRGSWGFCRPRGSSGTDRHCPCPPRRVARPHGKYIHGPSFQTPALTQPRLWWDEVRVARCVLACRVHLTSVCCRAFTVRRSRRVVPSTCPPSFSGEVERTNDGQLEARYLVRRV
jgi:hypothetical protein